jgi:glutamyl-tRNA synthetase
MAITRFAPSPTGYLHIGGLRTALYSYLWAKKTNGEFKLRIEDTDQDRNNDDAVKAILEAFDWVGMPSDCKIEYQSKRGDIYTKYINQLLDEGKAYKCYMSKDELAQLRATQEANKQTPRYDGTWRPENGKILPPIPKNIKPVIRIKAPKNMVYEFEDGIKGKMKFEANQVDDYIIARANGTPTYNFVVAIDDHLMGITDVLRGDDHLANTPKQILIYKALGFDIPKFYHIPMINNPQGKKLSKRDGAMDVMQYKKDGYLPQALLNFLVRLGWSNADQEIFSMEEMLEFFNPNDISKSASTYNTDKLNWLNSEYIKKTANNDLEKLLKDFDLDLTNINKKDFLLEIMKQRANTLVQLKNNIQDIINRPKQYDKKGVKKFIKANILDILINYVKLLDKNKNILNSIKDIENITKPFIEKNNLKFPQFFQPIRIALTGKTQAPSVYDIIYILGINESSKRIYDAIQQNFLL